jgi:hypothetical protein
MSESRQVAIHRYAGPLRRFRRPGMAADEVPRQDISLPLTETLTETPLIYYSLQRIPAPWTGHDLRVATGRRGQALRLHSQFQQVSVSSTGSASRRWRIGKKIQIRLRLTPSGGEGPRPQAPLSLPSATPIAAAGSHRPQEIRAASACGTDRRLPCLR